MTGDQQLLRQYARERSEPAFGELVRRHIDLVYSVALRVTRGDRQLAEDVTQTVFIDLARKASILPEHVLLPGWLYRHAGYTAAKAVRTESRRKTREQTALEMRALYDHSEASWRQIAPQLEDSLNQLSASDRDAIVLRFLKQQDLRAVGVTLGINEDAAQKRVSRALDKLRSVLIRRGIQVTGATLASVLAAEAVTAAPAGLAVSVVAASLATTAGTGASLTMLKLMVLTKLKTGVVSAIVIASVITPLVIHYQTQFKLKDKDEWLRRHANQAAQIAVENRSLSNLLAQAKSPPSFSNDQFKELLRLRGEIGRMRSDLRELAPSATTTPMSLEEVLAVKERLWSARASQLKQWLEDHPSEKIPELRFLTDRDWLDAAYPLTFENEEEYRSAMRIARANAESRFHSTLFRALRRYAQDHDGQFPGDLAQLKPFFKSPVDEAILRRYEIVPASSLVGELQAGGDWLITQKAPVNEVLDIRVAIGLTNLATADDLVTNRWLAIHR